MRIIASFISVCARLSGPEDITCVGMRDSAEGTSVLSSFNMCAFAELIFFCITEGDGQDFTENFFLPLATAYQSMTNELKSERTQLPVKRK